MQSNTYNARQGYSVLAMFLIGSAVVLSPGREAKSDIWLAVLVAFLAAVPLAILYGRLLQIYPGKTLYDMQLEYFGPVLGRVSIAIYTWYALHTSAIILREFTEFIQINSFPYLPQYLFALPLGILCIWCIRAGAGTLGRWCIIVAPVFMGLLVFNSLISIPQWHFEKIKPVLYDGIGPVLDGASKLIALPFLEVPLVVLLCQPFSQPKKAITMFLNSFALAAVVLVIIFLRNILVLSEPLVDKLMFPSYNVVKLASIGDFIQGLEVLAAVVFMTGYYVKLTVFLYAAVVGVAKLAGNVDYRRMAAPVGMMFLTFSLFVTPNIIDLFAWVPAVFTYYSLPIGLFFPLLLWAIGEWKWHKRKQRTDPGPEGEKATAEPGPPPQAAKKAP